MQPIQTPPCTSGTANQCRVCVISGSPDLGLVTCRLLAKLGYKTSAALDGFAGLRLVLDTQPDAVLTCMVLPGLDGFQLASKIRDRFPERPILIAHTSYCLSTIRTKARDAGFDVLLAKPARVELLLKAVAFQRQ